eukprot:TRINITY_DN1431_c0_g1_i5.p1 TRINITY_DN1431_c0_g1~~TRINITY_DN1431_c0_g1_i5.p1  ORF type:complete len:394 (+),score=90.79 TRINITY_DN1431_c0_g1_i5:101-1282(+)
MNTTKLGFVAGLACDEDEQVFVNIEFTSKKPRLTFIKSNPDVEREIRTVFGPATASKSCDNVINALVHALGDVTMGLKPKSVIFWDEELAEQCHESLMSLGFISVVMTREEMAKSIIGDIYFKWVDAGTKYKQYELVRQALDGERTSEALELMSLLPYPSWSGNRELCEKGLSVLFAACYSIEAVEEWLRGSPSGWKWNSWQNGETALCMAANCGCLEVCELLIEGCSQSYLGHGDSSQGSSPLHRACRNGDLNIIRLLLDAHPPLMLQPGKGYMEGMTPFVFLIRFQKGDWMDAICLMLEKAEHPASVLSAGFGQKSLTPIDLLTSVSVPCNKDSMKAFNIMMSSISADDVHDVVHRPNKKVYKAFMQNFCEEYPTHEVAQRFQKSKGCTIC